jgi:hypothetical protein
MAERVGFVLNALFYILQVAESNMPPLPRTPRLPHGIARHCPLTENNSYGKPARHARNDGTEN